MSTIGTDCELTESVIFQPVDQIQTSKSSWVFTTAVDFTPYLETISNVINYGITVRQVLMISQLLSTGKIQGIRNY